MSHRYFTTDISGGTATLSGADAAHLARVLRAKPGDALTLCDCAGHDYEAEITSVQQSQIILKILSNSNSIAEPSIQVTSYIGFAKGERMDFAVQKAVELGAAAIVPFFSENCVVKPKGDNKLERFERIAHEAAKQSGRGIIPAVRPALAFGDMLADAAQNQLALFFYECGGKPLAQCLGKETSIALITGAEGGFTPAEAAAAMAAGCLPVGLGPRILRSETAAMAALAAVMALKGELQ